jgi:hypothetical protein
LVACLSGRGARAMVDRLGGGLPGGEIFPINETTFFMPSSQVPIRETFVQNRKGKTVGMAINLGGTKIKGVRVSD